jgi:hypothetical protein
MQSEARAASPYTRTHPSPRYQQLLAQYRHMHEHGAAGVPPQEMFSGISLPPQAMRIAGFIKQVNAETLLDYGCGKAVMYRANNLNVGQQSFPSLQAFWGLKSITLYDPAYPPHMTLPQGTFDIVISTDVLEHCPEDDVPWILSELFGYAKKFVFANVACYPAKKILPNGENAHCTIQPVSWWKAHIDALAAAYPALQYQFIFTEAKNEAGEIRKVESVIERMHGR